MLLREKVRISRRFQRSIRIDTDINKQSAVEGFVCPQSSAEVLKTMARHIRDTGQGAFTWTGPYGSGKSSLIVALSTWLSGDLEIDRRASETFEESVRGTLESAMPRGDRGWLVVPIVGRRASPVALLSEAMTSYGVANRAPSGGWDERSIVTDLVEYATSGKRDGVVLFIDEMGKLLEAAALDGSDIYLLQELAEAASRSEGRLVVVGVLHQAFEEYAHRLSHDVRDEWAKIQGRFVDLVVDTAGEEQVELIGRAIETEHSPAKPSNAAHIVAGMIRHTGNDGVRRLAEMLENCWPLHPVVASLLGPVSRRRFGQNQRSLFGFLNSAEPHAFQDFLSDAQADRMYTPDRLWDYLRVNLEPSILASPDGHRWALAAEAIERCEATNEDEFHLQVLKTIAVIDLFKERSGLIASGEVLQACFPDAASSDLKTSLEFLERGSFTIFRKFQGAHSVFAGSDFDIESAVSKALRDIDDVNFAKLRSLAGLQPILAKRHYHITGSMRWFDVNVVPVRDVARAASKFKPAGGSIGQFLLAVPTDGESDTDAHNLCKKAASLATDVDIVVGISKQSWAIVPLAKELFALDDVRNSHAELAGDSVARREVVARIAALQAMVDAEIHKAFDNAVWFRKDCQPTQLRAPELNGVASSIADDRYNQAPRLHNELLNRPRPSGNAIAAQNILLRHMVLNQGQERLGIVGYPAEGGLFASLLEWTGLYRRTGDDNNLQFASPSEGEDPANLLPMWKAAEKCIQESDGSVTLMQIYDVWSAPPYGVKAGLMPVLAVAFILCQSVRVAAYRDGIFRARFDDVDVQYLTKDPAAIQLRWMDLDTTSRTLLSGLADVVRTFDETNSLVHLTPIDVARGLVAIYDELPQWSKRTMLLSANAIQVRELFKRAKDPNRFLFDDIPCLFGQKAGAEDDLATTVDRLQEGLEELAAAYPLMTRRLRELMLEELHVPNDSAHAIAELRARAENITQLAGDFRLDAFIGRLSRFDGSDVEFEGIASLAANKPPQDWVDSDLDKSAVELAELSQKFVRAETFARVKRRPQKRHAMAVVIGNDSHQSPLLGEFEVADSDREEVESLILQISKVVGGRNSRHSGIVLAALAEVSAGYIKTESNAVTEKFAS